MKNTILLLILALSLQNAMTQIRVYPVFTSTHSGRSINILASGQLKNRHELGGGLRFNINKYAHNDDQNNIFKKRMWATQPIHYFGLEGFYHVHLFQKLPHIDIFAFYDIQLAYSTVRNRSDDLVRNPVTGEKELVEMTAIFGPFTWIEQNIGIGFTVDIWKNIFFTQRLGAGVDLILGRDKPFSETKRHYIVKERCTYEFGYLLSVGIGYRFEPKKK